MTNLSQLFTDETTREINLPAKSVIARAGEPLESFYYLQAGCVRMSSTSPNGQVVTLHLFFPGACFSLLTLTQPFNNFDFVSLTDVTLRKLPSETVINQLKNDPALAYETLRKMTQGTHGLLQRIQNSQALTAYQQIASLLTYFAKHVSDALPTGGLTTTGVAENSDPLAIPLRLTHQDLADWLGLSRENVSLNLKKLEREGALRQHHARLEITDLHQLKAIALRENRLL